MRVLVCGSRNWHKDDLDPITEEIALLLNEARAEDITIVHGAARGADDLADFVARDMGMNVEPHPADWDQFGKRAGFLRNKEMVDSGVDRVIAFKTALESRGTDHTIKLAIAAGIPVTQIFAPGAVSI